ncbi:TIGR04141 family sporadically distributed protein [Kangiella japonica]|uniref:TIGR04141 family sporadically distributed protein n=1 Tax=Kangiella japonica TaxID=647384 RepID=A0ABN0SUG6_9GAMM
MKTHKLSIYLVKNDYKAPKEILNIHKAQKEQVITYGNSSKGSLFVKKRTQSNLPMWTEIFNSKTNKNTFHFTETLGAVFLCKVEGRIFILSFGTGFHLIREWAIERDFGLKVTLNTVVPNKLRSLDKASYDHNPLNSRTQSMKEVDIYNLDLDSEMDMVYAVGGTSKIKRLGSYIAGKDSLSLSLKFELNDLNEILETVFEQYNIKVPDEFSWIENVNKVRDKKEIEEIEEELNIKLRNKQYDSIFLGEPEVTDWDTKLYSFDMRDKTARYEVLKLEEFVSYKGGKINLEDLKKGTINVNNGDYEKIKSWSLFRCVYTEIKYKGNNYILRNSDWYKVNNNFVSKVNKYLNTNIVHYGFKFPIYAESEEAKFNSHVARQYEFIENMDKKTIPIGGSYDKVEHCDLVKDGNEFIHVKYYSSSSTLSHLFAQGFVASEAFIADIDYRKKLNEKLPKRIKLKNYQDRPNPSNYTVVFAIATKKKLPSELPFFSKVSLKNAHKKLKTLGFNVALSTIDINEQEIEKKKYKAKKQKNKKTAKK